MLVMPSGMIKPDPPDRQESNGLPELQMYPELRSIDQLLWVFWYWLVVGCMNLLRIIKVKPFQH